MPAAVACSGEPRKPTLSERYEGEREPAKRDLCQYRLTLEFQREWSGNWYAIQQVVPIVAEEAERFVVITVYTYYF